MRVWLVALMMALAASSTSASEIRVMAAGSLKDAFTAAFADFSKQYGASFRLVWGPSGTLRERLQLIFGDAAHLSLTPNSPRGAVVEIDMPAHT